MATRDKKEQRRARRKDKFHRERFYASSEADLLIYGPIDEFELSAKDVNNRLVAIGSQDPINVRINSGGGSLFEGLAIYNMLSTQEATVNVMVEGVALSIASVIAMAGDHVAMAENALMMIHDPRAGSWGESSDLRKQADVIDKAAEQLRATYMARTGMDEDQLKAMMAAETWMTAKEALELGFIDEVVPAKKVVARFDPDKYDVPEDYCELVAGANVEGKDLSSSADDQIPKGFEMNQELRAKLVALGMDESLSDEDAQKWMLTNWSKLSLEAKGSTQSKEPPKQKDGDFDLDKVVATVTDIVDQRQAAKDKARAEFRAEVDANLELVFGDSVPADVQAKCYAAGDMAKARQVIKDARATGDDVNIVFSRTQPRDRHVNALRASFQSRAMSAAGISQKQIEEQVPELKDGTDWQDFQNMDMNRIARECLLIDGYDERSVNRLSAPDIAKAAFGFARSTALRNEAINVTGTLGDITMDAVNKTLLAGYEAAPQTWRGPMRQAASVPDFKNINRIRLGSVPNLPDWPDNTPPEEAKLTDQKVQYAVEAKAEKVSFSWRLFVNDDMDALSRIPQMLGDAAARTVNKVAWTVVNSNPTMEYDSVALFAAASGARKRVNLITGSATPTTATVGTMTKQMRLMRGMNTAEGNESDEVLNLSPKYLAAPAALEQTVLQLINSTADPAASGNSGIFNTTRTLIPIIEPLLDANSAKAWYLFADPARIDTIEVTFLQGQETPATYDWIDNETLSRNMMVVQTFQAKAIDHRGVQKHAGE
jgi:ATP-dependent Clp endopeptidase proteolytic subunit ClpP